MGNGVASGGVGGGMPSAPPCRTERAALCDLLLELGPDAPTLCEGWTTSHLAAHLVVRERNPIASIGIVLPAAAGLHDKAIERRRTSHSYEENVARIRKGVPFTWKPVEALFNTQEYFTHLEDARRGGGDYTPRPADEIAEVEDTLWRMTKKGAGYAARGIKGVGVDFVRDDGETVHARKGDDVVSIVGRPGEIVLFLMGRKDAAQVKLEGSPEAIAKAEGADLGI